MESADLEEFNQIFNGLHVSLQNKVNLLLTNFQIDKEKFLDVYQFYEYNISRDRENQSNISVPLEQEVITQIEKKLIDEGR